MDGDFYQGAKMSSKILLTAVLAMCCHTVQADFVWQPAPPEAKPQGGHSGHGGHRGGKPFHLTEATGAEAEMWLPTLVRRPLHLGDEGRVSVGGTGVDNYHALVAKKRDADVEAVAIRYIYQHGKPSGESPSSLVNHAKASLVITPTPLTREHQRYQSQNEYRYQVRFNGKPLADKAVTLRTSHGSEVQGVTDEEGRIRLAIPDDFSSVVAGRSNNDPADFYLSVEHNEGGREYRTTLSAPYYVNPSHWRSTGGGLAAMFAGVITGFVVLRRSRRATDEAERA